MSRLMLNITVWTGVGSTEGQAVNRSQQELSIYSLDQRRRKSVRPNCVLISVGVPFYSNDSDRLENYGIPLSIEQLPNGCMQEDEYFISENSI